MFTSALPRSYASLIIPSSGGLAIRRVNIKLGVIVGLNI